MRESYPPKLKTFDNDSYATDPGLLRLSHAKFRRFHPEFYGVTGVLNSVVNGLCGRFGTVGFLRTRAEEQLMYGDSCAAIVLSTELLLIAAYSDDIDCVTVLYFPQELVKDYELATGMRLLTVNTYGEDIAPDLTPGPHALSEWKQFHPLIAEFLTDDQQRLAQRKAEISEEKWQRVYDLGQDYLRKHPGMARIGRPLESFLPARQLCELQQEFSVLAAPTKPTIWPWMLMVFILLGSITCGVLWGVNAIKYYFIALFWIGVMVFLSRASKKK